MNVRIIQRPRYPDNRLQMPALQAPSKVKTAAASRSILPAVLLFYAALLPPEVRVEIADQTLYSPRIVGLLLCPWLIWQAAKHRRIFRFVDLVFLIGAFWPTVSFVALYGLKDGLSSGVALTLDYALPYLIARLAFEDLNSLRRFLVYASMGLGAAGASMFLEVLADKPLIRASAASVFGNLQAYDNQGLALGARGLYIDNRFGILRAQGPFSHPILAGVVLASFLPLYFNSYLRGWPKAVGFWSALLCIISGSTTAFLLLIYNALILTYDWLQRTFEFLSWKLFIFYSVLFVFSLELLSGRGLSGFAINLSLSQSSGYFRRSIWDYGSTSVLNNPLFGIGRDDYERPRWMFTGSVDHHWLALAVKNGVIASFPILITAIFGLFLLMKMPEKISEHDRRLRVALAITLFGIIVVGCAVAYFGGALVWVYMVLGIAISVGAASQPKLGTQHAGSFRLNSRAEAGQMVRSQPDAFIRKRTGSIHNPNRSKS